MDVCIQFLFLCTSFVLFNSPKFFMRLSKNIGSEKKDLQFWIRYPIRRKNQLPEIRLKADIQSLKNYQYQWQNQKASGTLTNLVGNLIPDQIKPYWKEHYPDDPTKKFEAALRSGFFIVFLPLKQQPSLVTVFLSPIAVHFPRVYLPNHIWTFFPFWSLWAHVSVNSYPHFGDFNLLMLKY